MAEVAIEKYDQEGRDKKGRNDFLAWLSNGGREVARANVSSRSCESHCEKFVNLLSPSVSNGKADVHRLAGRDTTAMALRAVFYFFIKNPRCHENC
jgi:hypothetical protein